MTSYKIGLLGSLIFLPAALYAGPFHPRETSLEELGALAVQGGCDALTLQEPELGVRDYQGLWSNEWNSCQRYTLAFRVMEDLTASDERIRYLAIRTLFPHWNKQGPSNFFKAFQNFEQGLPSSAMARAFSSQLTLMATADKSHIASYARQITKAELMNVPLQSLDLSQRSITGTICYHSPVEDINLSFSTWEFTQITRFCNFKNVQAEGARFRGNFTSQTFQDSSFQKSVWELRNQPNQSWMTFVNCDLREARINGDIRDVHFQNSDLTGAVINGKTCLNKDGSDCLFTP